MDPCAVAPTAAGIGLGGGATSYASGTCGGVPETTVGTTETTGGRPGTADTVTPATGAALNGGPTGSAPIHAATPTDASGRVVSPGPHGPGDAGAVTANSNGSDVNVAGIQDVQDAVPTTPDVAGVQALSPAHEIAGVQALAPNGIVDAVNSIVASALPATGGPVALLGAGLLSLAGFGTLVRRIGRR